jgi:hypothetical protein
MCKIAIDLLMKLEKDPSKEGLLCDYLEVSILNYYLIVTHHKNNNRAKNSKCKNILIEREIVAFKEALSVVSLLFTSDKYKAQLQKSLDCF